MAGGSTLGNISNTQVPVKTVDIGLAQLAMHSAMETASCKDAEYMAKAVADEKIAKFLQKQGGQIVKTIVVKNKLVNLIVK